MAKIRLTATIGAIGSMRRELDRAIHDGLDFTYTEGSGLLSRDFYVTGDNASIVAISEWVNRIRSGPGYQ